MVEYERSHGRGSDTLEFGRMCDGRQFGQRFACVSEEDVLCLNTLDPPGQLVEATTRCCWTVNGLCLAYMNSTGAVCCVYCSRI